MSATSGRSDLRKRKAVVISSMMHDLLQLCVNGWCTRSYKKLSHMATSLSSLNATHPCIRHGRPQPIVLWEGEEKIQCTLSKPPNRLHGLAMSIYIWESNYCNIYHCACVSLTGQHHLNSTTTITDWLSLSQ